MSNPSLFNKFSKEDLTRKLEQETFDRTTLSFYRYVMIDDPEEYRDRLYLRFDKLGILGRIYVAGEGINAQICVPEPNFDEFRSALQNDPHLTDMPLKIAVEDHGRSFLKLIIKTRKKIVADGLDDGTFDVTNVGTHLSAEEFNKALDDPSSIVIDMRNHYESEVGHFRGALLPDTDTFRETLPAALETVRGKEDSKILLYCTGGIRCEKASAYFKHHGFSDVNQLHGGIIDYARQVKKDNLDSKFTGKNFVFDDRLGERISDEVIAHCHQCGDPSDVHVNCANDDCHMLFIQCDNCREKYDGCCSEKCNDIHNLPLEEQKKLRKGPKVRTNPQHYRKSRWDDRPA